MKAQIITQYGAPNVFTTMDIPKPTCKPGHAIVRVLATSVNQIDCKIRSGSVSIIAPALPAVLHGDVAGIIEEVGPEISDFKIGDEVYGCAGGVKGLSGALAEFMLTDVRLLAKKPKSLSMTETAALPLVAITAWEALFNKVNLSPGKTVLIHGGLGGVGHIGLQLAKYANTKVFTTVSSEEDFALAKKLGADEVINFKTESVEHYVQRLTHGYGFDIIFDTVGGDNLKQSFIAAKINGAVVTTAARTTQDLTPLHQKGLSLHAVFMLLPMLYNVDREEHGKILTKVAEIVDQNKLKPLLDPHTFSFNEVAKAHTLLESGQARGKVVLQQNC